MDDRLQPPRLASPPTRVASHRAAAASLRQNLFTEKVRSRADGGGGGASLRAGAQARAVLEHALVPVGTAAVPGERHRLGLLGICAESLGSLCSCQEGVWRRRASYYAIVCTGNGRVSLFAVC